MLNEVTSLIAFVFEDFETSVSNQVFNEYNKKKSKLLLPSDKMKATGYKSEFLAWSRCMFIFGISKQAVRDTITLS